MSRSPIHVAAAAAGAAAGEVVVMRLGADASAPRGPFDRGAPAHRAGVRAVARIRRCDMTRLRSPSWRVAARAAMRCDPRQRPSLWLDLLQETLQQACGGGRREVDQHWTGGLTIKQKVNQGCDLVTEAE